MSEKNITFWPHSQFFEDKMKMEQLIVLKFAVSD